MFEKEISNGVEFLNKVNPGWYNKINLEKFSINSDTCCVLGQVYGSYSEAVTNLNIDYDQRISYCFTSCEKYPFTEQINQEWKERIKNLQMVSSGQDNILDNIPEKVYSKDEVKELLLEVMNLGMTLRQNQLNGQCGKSGREVLEEFIKKVL